MTSITSQITTHVWTSPASALSKSSDFRVGRSAKDSALLGNPFWGAKSDNISELLLPSSSDANIDHILESVVQFRFPATFELCLQMDAFVRDPASLLSLYISANRDK